MNLSNKDRLYERTMELADNLVDEYLVSKADGLWSEDFLSPEETDMKRKLSRLIFRRAETAQDNFIWMEDKLYHQFFVQEGIDNRFEPGAARILVDELEYGQTLCHMKEIHMLKQIILTINDIQTERNKYDSDLNGKSYDELFEKYESAVMMQHMRMDRRINSSEYKRNPDFTVVELRNAQQAKTFCRYMPEHFQWDFILDEEKFNEMKNRPDENYIYVILHKDFRDMEIPDHEYNADIWLWNIDYSLLGMENEESRPIQYDRYGMSMIAVVVDSNGRLIYSSGRYGDKYNYEYGSDFMDEEEISLLIGRNFYDVFI